MLDNVAKLGKRRQPIAVAEASRLFFNHEPWAAASRNARLGRVASPPGLKADAFSRRRRHSPKLRPWGWAAARVTKTRVPRDTKTCQASRRSTKSRRGVFEPSAEDKRVRWKPSGTPERAIGVQGRRTERLWPSIRAKRHKRRKRTRYEASMPGTCDSRLRQRRQ